MGSIYTISNELKNIYNQIESGEGIDMETGEIKPEIMKALALSQQNLQDKAIDYAYVLKSFDDTITIYDNEINRLTDQKKKLSKIKETLKNNLTKAMETFNIVEIKGKTLKLSLRKSEKVEVYNLDLLEDRYKTIKIEPNKTAIKQAIKNGQDVQGAKIVENNNLQIR